MPNQRVNAPYGDIFFVDTPNIDNLSRRLYEEKRQKDAQQQQEVKALDNEFAQNVSKIKDADIDDLTKLYGDYKLASQQLIKNKANANPKQQLELLRKKAEMYKLINESKQEMEDAKLLGTAITKDSKGLYDEKAAARLQARLKTPTRKLGEYSELDEKGNKVPVNLLDNESYLYKLGASDFSKDLDAARGKDRDLTPDERIEDPKDPLMWLTKQYKGKNSPIEFYNTLLPRIAGQKEQKDFVLRTELDYPPEKLNALEGRYKQLISDPNYRKRYGLKEGDDLPLSSYDTPLTKAVRIRAMEHAVANPVIEKVEKLAKNTSAAMEKAQELKLKYAAVQNAYIRGRQRLTQQSEGLGKYDVLGLYYPKATPFTKKVKVGGGIFPKYEDVEEYRIPANEVDANHKKLFGNVAPYSDDEGNKYYIVRDDGDWEGKGGQVISRASVATEKQGKTTLSEEKRGVPDMQRLPKDIKNTRLKPKGKYD